nr:hypothetical protein BHI3_13080 [Bacteriovorax sp. HI3]
MKNNNYGFSLAEIMISMGILGILSLSVMKVNGMIQKGQAASETKMEEIELRRVIALILTDREACKNTFSGKNVGQALTQIKSSSNNVLYEVNKVYGNNALKITSFKTLDLAQPFSDNTRMIHLNVSFQRMKQILNNSTILSANIPLRVKSPSASGLISECFADVDSIIQQSCLSSGGTWTGSNCQYPQYVLKSGDTMTGVLNAPEFKGSFTGNVTGNLNGNVTGNISGATGQFSGDVSAARFCTSGHCQKIENLALANISCSNGQTQIGVKADGSPNCKSLQCSGNHYFAGLDSSNNPICRPYPTNTCPTNEYVSQVNSDGTVTCSILPNNANSVCPSGQVIQSINAGTPSCVNKGAGTNCATGEVVVAVKNDGSVTCEKAKGFIAPTYAEGAACNANDGNIALSTQGKLMSCYGGSWKAASGGGGCRMCRSCGGNYPYYGGKSDTKDKDWSGSEILDYGCGGGYSYFNAQARQVAHLCCAN